MTAHSKPQKSKDVITVFIFNKKYEVRCQTGTDFYFNEDCQEAIFMYKPIADELMKRQEYKDCIVVELKIEPEKKEELLQYEDELCGRDDDASRLRDLAYYMHGAQELGMKAFEFHDGSFCDAQTGKRLPNSIEGFLSFNFLPFSNEFVLTVNISNNYLTKLIVFCTDEY